MKIDTHAHYMAKSFYEAIEAMPGVSRKADPYGLQLVRDGKTVVPLNEKWLDPDDQLREMDRKGFDMRLVSLTTPNLYIFPVKDQPEIGQRVNDETLNYCDKRIDRLRALASLPLFGAAREAIYECGMPTIGSAWIQVAVIYYLFALLFLAFDVDVLFLFPVLLAYGKGYVWRDFIEVTIFIGILSMVIVYAWCRGVFSWKRKQVNP